MPIIIKSKKEGFRRAGVAHSKQATEYPVDFFTDKQLAALEAEPMLTVECQLEEMAAPSDNNEQSDQGDGVEKTPVEAVDGQGQLIEGEPGEPDYQTGGVVTPPVLDRDRGVRINGAPADEAEFLSWLKGLTVPDLKDICADLEIDVPAKAKKADLIKLITFNTAFPPADPPVGREA